MTQIIVSFFKLLQGLVSKLPDLSVNNAALSNMISATDTVFAFIGKVNFFIPLDHMLVILGLVYTIRAGKLLLFVINWIIRRIADVIP